jgi:SAM-dependent methyltransferase
MPIGTAAIDTDRPARENLAAASGPLAAAEVYAEKVMAYKTGEVVSLMIHLGDRLGLYRALDGAGWQSSGDVAERTGLHERWLREWLHSQTAAGLVEHREGGFRLPAGAAPVLLDDRQPLHLAGWFHAPTPPAVLDRTAEAFETGVGITWDDHGPHVACALKRMTGPGHRALPEILERVDGLVERLHAGARVADVGCGSGLSLHVLAERFPASRFEGWDPSPVAVGIAAEEAERRGLDNVSFHVAGGEDLPAGAGYDLVLTLDCMHDLPRPRQVIGAIRAALAPDGVWVIKDLRSAGRLEDNLDKPMAAAFYGISILYCMSSAMSEPGGAGLGTLGFHPELAERMVREGGFGHFADLGVPVEQEPFDAYYEARP